MKYLGVVKNDHGHLVMPDAFRETPERRSYEAIEVGGDIMLMTNPLDRERMEHIQRLARQTIKEHRKTLEALAK